MYHPRRDISRESCLSASIPLSWDDKATVFCTPRPTQLDKMQPKIGGFHIISIIYNPINVKKEWRFATQYKTGGFYMSKKQRTLTKQEQRRKEKFDALCQTMAENGYELRDLTVSLKAANTIGIALTIPFLILTTICYFFIHPLGTSVFPRRLSILILVVFFVLIVAHEGIHGITWACFAPNHFHSIEFGVIWSALTPYCTCSAPLNRRQYILGALMPTLILGFGLAAVSIALHQLALFLVAQLMILSGGGDFLIVAQVLRYRTDKQNVVFLDHPYECGVVAFEKE